MIKQHGVLFHDLLILIILLSSSYNSHLISAASTTSPLIHKPLVSSSSSSSVDVQENNVDHRGMTNGRLLVGEGQSVVSIDRHGFGGGHGASRGGGHGASRGGNGGGRDRGGSVGPRTIGVIPIYAAGAANNHRYTDHRRNAATSLNKIGFITLSTGLIFALLVLLTSY